MKSLILVSIVILAAVAVGARAECVNGEVLRLPTDSDESDVTMFFKNVGCSIQNGAKKLGGEIKEGAKKFKEGAKKLGSNVKTKFTELKDKITASDEAVKPADDLLAQVERIDPDLLKAEQKCGKGYILDAFQDCKKN